MKCGPWSDDHDRAARHRCGHDVAGRRVGTYSLGMRQRLGLAAALLGDPEVLLLDEPANGLDPEGIRWLRTLLRERVEPGRAVLVSIHLLTEAAHTVDDIVVVRQGRVIHTGPIADLTPASGRASGQPASLEDVYVQLIGAQS